MLFPILFLFLQVLSSAFAHSSQYSGVYHPFLKYTSEDVAGAVLITKSRLIRSALPLLSTAQSFHGENAIVEVLKYKCKSCLTLMTRDYLDFLVENLSMYVNALNRPSSAIIRHISKNVKKTSQQLKSFVAHLHNFEPRASKTVALLVYSSAQVLYVTSKMKLQFFVASFRSVYRYFPHIVVMVGTENDQTIIRKLNLPVTLIFNLNVTASSYMEFEGELLKRSVTKVATEWETDLSRFQQSNSTLRYSPIDNDSTRSSSLNWTDFQYMFLMKANQLLHQRGTNHLFDVLDSSYDGSFILVPHRMQVSDDLKKLYIRLPYMNVFVDYSIGKEFP